MRGEDAGQASILDGTLITGEFDSAFAVELARDVLWYL